MSKPTRTSNHDAKAAKERSRRERTSMYWVNKSGQLAAAAGALWYCMDVSRERTIAVQLGYDPGFSLGCSMPVFRMLCWLSIEAYFKAKIVLSTSRRPPATHDLLSLAERAAVDFTEEHRQVIRMLELSILWEGKYPAPKEGHETQMKEFAELQIGKKTGQFLLSKSFDWAMFNAIEKQIAAAFWAACPEWGPPDPAAEAMNEAGHGMKSFREPPEPSEPQEGF